ncbi:MAG: MMPL family transporter [Thermoleophilia bacterium]|nr:MMPL family transporter [Thermoleophilia bacterium]
MVSSPGSKPTRATMFDRLAKLADSRARRVVLTAFAFFLVSAAVGGGVASHLGPYGAEDKASESIRADEKLTGAGYRPADTTVLISGVDVERSAADRREVDRVRREVLNQPEVRSATGFNQTGSPAFVSRDGDATFLAVALDSTDDAVQQETAAHLNELFIDRKDVLVGGLAMANEQVNNQVETDLRKAEMLAFPLLFLLSLFFFRSAVAALLPLLVGGLAIFGTFLGLRIGAEIGSISLLSLNLVTGLGLGLAIDYSLFIVSRYREEIAVSGTGLTAMKKTMNTAGRTVLFSSLTVAASMAALLIFPQRFLYSMGLGGAMVALLSAAVALIVLPAVLTMLGERVNGLAPAFLQRRGRREAGSDRRGFWYRLSRFVMKHPGPIAAVTTLGLILLAMPALSMHFVPVDSKILPPGTSSRELQTTLDRDFPAGDSETIRVVVEGSPGEVRAASAQVARIEGIASVPPPVRLGPALSLIEADSQAGYMEARTRDAVDDLRSAGFGRGAEVNVSGATSRFLDFQQSLINHLPVAVMIIVAATLLILFLFTGSVVLPVKSLLMNMLTLGAVFGILVLIFQEGHLHAALDFTTPGGVDQTMPILILATTFALSTDYAVFLLSRIKEARDSGNSDSESVALGLERTGRIVTVAALLFAIAIGAFATSEIVFVKELGVGTALAVLIDATIIRALLVPSLMELLGRRNWWAPEPLRRLHDRWGLSEEAPDRS